MHRIAVVTLVAAVAATTAPGAIAAAPELVLYSADATNLHGTWTRVPDATAAGGQYLSTPDAGWSSVNAPLAAPNDYFDVAFTAPASTAYHVWFRMRATANSKYNDSAWVQYSDAVSNGAAVYALGSANALLLNLENCAGCGDSGWGWKDGAYWLSQASTIQFSSSGPHTMRVQVREDGVQIDQIVLSPANYLSSAPGATMNDATIVPKPAAPPPPAGSTPYLGTAAAIPGTIKAENYDNGGPGVAYADTTPGNSGGAYRATDVDIEPSSNGGYDVGWIDAGEWLTYSVNVAASGQYTVRFNVASLGQGGTFHLELNGANVTGSLVIPNTGGWQSWQTLTSTVTLTAGPQKARIVMDGPGTNAVGNLGAIEFASATITPPPPSPVRTPYTGTPAAIPGRIESVNFDNGAAGVAYSDTSAGNSGGAYRAGDVDIEAGDGGFNIGWTAAGEWLDYSVNVAAAGSYLAQMRVAAPSAGGVLHLSFNTAGNVSAAVSIPATGGWQTWTTISVPVTLGAGAQTMMVAFDSGGFNLGAINVVAATTAPPTQSSSVAVVLTTYDGAQRLAPQPPVTFAAGSGNSSLPTIVVDDTVRYQQIDGFGGSITDAGAWMLSGISADRQASIMSALFDRTSGIGINFLRQPIGSSDFARVAYTFDDITPTATDYALTSFSIDHDRPYILPALRAARAVNPSIRVLASPWTAPAWMKNTRTLSDGGVLNPEAFGAYADYLVKFIQAYQAEGIPIDALTVQNEPLTAPPYPSMYMTSDDQAAFIGQYLGPALARAALRPKVFAWDHNWDTTYPFAVLANAAAASYVSGVAFHCYGGDPSAMTSFHQAYPQLDIALTECADSSRVSFGVKLVYDVRSTIIGSLRNWAKSVAKWNLILDETGGPKLYSGACRNCAGMVTIHSATGAISYNEDYYAIGHASRFIQRGAYRVDSTTFPGGIENVAAVNPDGSLVVLAVNTGDNPITFQIQSRAASLQYTLAPGSVATFSWNVR